MSLEFVTFVEDQVVPHSSLIWFDYVDSSYVGREEVVMTEEQVRETSLVLSEEQYQTDSSMEEEEMEILSDRSESDEELAYMADDEEEPEQMQEQQQRKRLSSRINGEGRLDHEEGPIGRQSRGPLNSNDINKYEQINMAYESAKFFLRDISKYEQNLQVFKRHFKANEVHLTLDSSAIMSRLNYVPKSPSEVARPLQFH